MMKGWPFNGNALGATLCVLILTMFGAFYIQPIVVALGVTCWCIVFCTAQICDVLRTTSHGELK